MKSPSAQPHGFDAAVMRREDDYLNRWPLAREIYGIATTGPRDWSVRIGIYGEWGTGKTSVLKFVDTMATKDEHIVIWFDPWEYSTKAELWRAFVLTVFEGLEARLGTVEGAQEARRKAFIEKAKGVVGAITGLVNEQAGKVVESGLDLVKKHFAFSEEDLESLQDSLGEKRVIILVDDLDRTAPELVPEILFTLKELMNIPGFSYVSAFDPMVVGKVLHQYHRGFGDGLKFLEKIIDYPRWLPPPASAGLAKLAVADAKSYCDYVPEADLRDAVQLLPANPRSVRQFIRLLKLLGPQIKRHDRDELRWPAILAANVIKVCHPRLAHALLNDIEFWGSIEGVTIMDRSEEQVKLTEEVKKQVESVDASQNTHLNPADKASLVRAMMPLCSNISLWLGGGAEVQVYQMNIAESPHAVTGKEFNEFCSAWNREPTAKIAAAWITSHATQVERLPIEVYRELLSSTLDRYLKTLRQPDSVRLIEERLPILKQVEVLISMLECLVLELGQIDKPEKLLRSDEVETIFEAFATNLRSYSKTTDEFCVRNEKLLNQLIERWQGDVTPLVNAIVPYGYWGSRRYDGDHAMALHERLSRAIKPRLAAQVIAGLRQPDYVQRIWTQDKGTAQIRCVFLAHDGPLWKDARTEFLAAIEDAGSSLTVQDNVYDLLHWFEHGFSEHAGSGDADNLKKLFQDKELLDALWAAATARPLSSYATIRLNNFVLTLKQIGLIVDLPTWWGDAFKQAGFKPEKTTNEQTVIST